ncbi:MAG TPA: response regulator [Planctomycetota bacterium]|nr:response regulator [Planctomycetota bacterium]
MAAEGNSGIILLVEDRPDEVELMKQALHQAGITNPLRIFSDGTEAISYLEGRDRYADRDAWPLPRLVLLDLKIRGRSGLEVVTWVKSRPRLQRIPVVVVTSSRETSDMEKAYAAGANSYLVKPTSFREFVETMKITATYWINVNASLEP